MRRIVNSSQMKTLDTMTIQKIGIPSLVLMERAAYSVVEELLCQPEKLKKVLVLCGMGNNGGDGIAVARILKEKNIEVFVSLSGNLEHISEETKIQKKIAEEIGIPFVQNVNTDEYTTIVDALFGIGLTREVEGEYLEKIQAVNQSNAFVVAVDIPSGVCANDGKVLGCAVCADLTITFAFQKAGLILYPGCEYAGKVVVKEIGIKEWEPLTEYPMFELEEEDLNFIPKRTIRSHKGTYGKVLLIAGSSDIFGAAYLSASAAFHMGIGMLKVITHKKNRIAFQNALPEAMFLEYDEEVPSWKALQEAISWADVVGIGPGIGTSSLSKKLFTNVLTLLKNRPFVVDADGLNLLAKYPALLEMLPEGSILTPHFAEMSRLTGLSIDEISREPVSIARQYAKTHQVTVILKDAHTITAKEDETIFINTHGSSGMATAGSGDVLTGIVLGVLARRTPIEIAAAIAVYIHSRLGEIAASTQGESYMLAGDMIDALKKILP